MRSTGRGRTAQAERTAPPVMSAAEPPVPLALPFRRELARKGLHLLSVAAPMAYAAGLSRRGVLAGLGGLALVALGVELARARHAATRAQFHGLVGALLREHERVRWSGATWLLLAMFALALTTPRDVAIAGMWALAAGDATAALAGRAFAATRAPRARPGRKTAVGSVACFVVTFAGALALAHLALGEALLAAGSATAAERPVSRVDDNVRIAAAVAVTLLVWRILFS